MGGRGANSASYAMRRRDRDVEKQAGHLDGPQIPKTPEETAKYLNVSVERAKELHGDVKDFTGSSYRGIRAAQRGDSDSPTLKKKGENLESYIENAPKWGGGTTYRGIAVDKKTAGELMRGWEAGAIIDINGGGTASWSTERTVAKQFATGGSTRLIFSCETQNMGTSIRHISKYKSESEVLVSKNARYKVIGTPKTVNGYTYVEVKEA